MDESDIIVKTAEIWKQHKTAPNVYSEQLSYVVVRPPHDFIEAILVLSGELELVSGFSVETGRHKIIGSDKAVIFASSDLKG